MTFVHLGEWLDRRAQLTPEKIGLIDSETQARLTYRALNTRAQALAAMLQSSYGIEQGDRVAILALNSPEYLDALFACARLGAILVPLNWRLTVRELVTILLDCEPKALVHDESNQQKALEAMSGIDHGLSLQSLPLSAFPGEDVSLATRVAPFHSSDGEETVLILYTSGTTGVPKGAMLSHRMLTWNAINTQVSWGLRETDSTPTFAPFFRLRLFHVYLTHWAAAQLLARPGDHAALRPAAWRHT